MPTELPASIFHEGVYLMSIVGAPLFLAVFVVGLVVGIIQSATQINDPAVGALPRLVVTLAVCILLGGWMVQRFATFLVSAVERMAYRAF